MREISNFWILEKIAADSWVIENTVFYLFILETLETYYWCNDAMNNECRDQVGVILNLYFSGSMIVCTADFSCLLRLPWSVTW